MRQIKAQYSLLALLLAIAATVIFPALGRVGLQSDEIMLADLARQFSSSGVSSVFDVHGTDFPGNFYAYLVSLTKNMFQLTDAFAVRLPSAIIIILLTLGMFQFRGQNETLNKSFLASLLFLSSYTVSALAYHANVITIMSLFFIFALSSLYHWTKRPSAEKAWYLITASACSAIFIGILSPVIILTIGIIFSFLQDTDKTSKAIKTLFMTAVGTAAAYIIVLFITNDKQSADNVLGIGQATYALEEYGKLHSFLAHTFFSIFPWSVPIIIALFWIACNPSWLRNKFLALSLFKQFGVVVFIISIPTLIAVNRLSLVMLLAAIYFNMPMISSFLLSQIHNHSVTWRITGGIFAALIASLAILFIATKAGFDISFTGFALTGISGWSIWSITLLFCILASLYTLWRNQRTIRFNNRYLYNIVILYLLAQILYKAFINPYLTVI